jgi:hypothetical protein
MPYAPGITYQPIQADMSGWGRALMQIMGQKDAKAEQAKKEAQEFKTYVAMGKQIGLNPDELTTADLGTVKGMVEGKITQTNLERAVAEFQKMQREGASQDALTQAVSRAGNSKLSSALAQGQGPIRPEPVSSQDILQSMVQNAPAALNSPQAVSVLEAMQRGEAMVAQKTPQDATPRLVNIGGREVLVSDITGKYDVLPNTTDSRLSERMQAIDRTALQRRKTDITKALANYLTPDVKEFYTQELESINNQLSGGSAAPEATAEPAKSEAAEEVERLTKDGRRAIFDAKTKKFLRYAE